MYFKHENIQVINKKDIQFVH